MLSAMPLATSAVLRGLGARPFELASGAARLRVWELGPEDGEPWILLHGLGSTGLSWRAPLARLKADCRLLVPELTEHGGSRCPDGGLNVRQGVAAVHELAAARCAGRPAGLAGISLGGWIAVRAALARPELFSRLILVAAAGYRDQDWERVARLVTIRDAGDLERFFGALFVRTPLALRLAKPLFRAAYQAPAVRHVLHSTAEADAFTAADLARLELPVGLVWGERDGLFPLAVGEAMAAALPRSRLSVLPRCAHGVQWEQPRLLAAEIDRLRGDLLTAAEPAAAPA